VAQRLLVFRRMRKFLVLVVLTGLAVLFVAQKRSESQKAAVANKSVAQAAGTPSPRPVSEHNWMKRSLDTTNEVKRQVAQQRKADGTR
jgi:hypothetical protein